MRQHSAEHTICVWIVRITFARLVSIPPSAQSCSRPLRLAAWVGASQLHGDDLYIHPTGSDALGARVVCTVLVCDELYGVVSMRGGGLAHVFIAAPFAVEERVRFVVVLEDLRLTEVQEDAAPFGVHKPHAVVLVAKRVLAVRDLHDDVTAKAVEDGAAQRMPCPRQVFGRVRVVLVVPLAVWSASRRRALTHARYRRHRCCAHLVDVEAPEVLEVERIRVR